MTQFGPSIEVRALQAMPSTRVRPRVLVGVPYL